MADMMFPKMLIVELLRFVMGGARRGGRASWSNLAATAAEADDNEVDHLVSRELGV
jgi:hypothetical protein